MSEQIAYLESRFLEPRAVEQNYVRFKDYEVSSLRATLKREVRIYGISYNIASEGIGLAGATTLFGDSGRYFPFVTVVTVGRGSNRREYFQLRNQNNEVVFTTDQDGMDVLFGGGNIAATA